MIYAKEKGAPAPEVQGGVAGAFYPPAANVRDLEKEGVLPAPVSIGGAALSTMMALIDLQNKNRDLRLRMERIEDVLAGLIKKQVTA